MKSDTLKSFGTIMFSTKHISAAQKGSNKSFFSTALNFSSIGDHLSWFIGQINLSLEGPSAVKSIMIEA